MVDNVVDLSEYRAKLNHIIHEARQEKEDAKRELMIALCNWFNSKVDEWELKRGELKAAVDQLNLKPDHESLDSENEMLLDYLNHLKLFGRLRYVFQGIEIIETEGTGWENDPTSAKTVLEIILNNL